MVTLKERIKSLISPVNIGILMIIGTLTYITATACQDAINPMGIFIYMFFMAISITIGAIVCLAFITYLLWACVLRFIFKNKNND